VAQLTKEQQQKNQIALAFLEEGKGETPNEAYGG
jgi:hypothetical protein